MQPTGVTSLRVMQSTNTSNNLKSKTMEVNDYVRTSMGKIGVVVELEYFELFDKNGNLIDKCKSKFLLDARGIEGATTKQHHPKIRLGSNTYNIPKEKLTVLTEIPIKIMNRRNHVTITLPTRDVEAFTRILDANKINWIFQ